MFRGKGVTPHPPATPSPLALRQRGEGGPERSVGRGEGRALVALLLLLLLTTACRQKMANQPRYDPLEPSDFFADGMSARPRLPNTVARGELSTNPFMETGKIGGQLGDGYPFPVTRQVLNRGQQRYDIYCAVCHSRTGDGNGMIPARGFRRPPSFHTDTLRTATTGHYFDVITNGFGAMPPYATQVSVPDRWAIIAYIRALQLSQNATVADVPAGKQASLDSGGPLPSAATSGGHH